MVIRFLVNILLPILISVATIFSSGTATAGDANIREIQRLLWALDYGATRLDGVDLPDMRTRASKFLAARGKSAARGDDQLLEELRAAFDQKKQALQKPTNNPEIVDRHGIADYDPQMFVSAEEDLVLAGVCPIYRFKLSNSAPLRTNGSCAQYHPFVYSSAMGTIAAGSRWQGEVYGLVLSDAASGLKTDFIEIPDNLFSEKMAIHPNGVDVLVMTWQNVWRVNLSSRAVVKVTSMPQVVLEGARISQDGRFFATDWSRKVGSNFVESLSVWDWVTGKKISETASKGIAFSNDGTLTALASKDSTVEIREIGSGRLVAKRHFEYPELPNFTYSDLSVVFSANNESLLYLDGEGKILHEWIFKSSEVRDRVKLVSKAARAVISTASGKIYTLEGDRVLTYDLAGGAAAEKKTLSPLSVVGGAISPDKKTMAIHGQDSLALADLATGVVTFIAAPANISAVSFPQTSDRLLTGNDQGEIVSLDLKTGKRDSVVSTNKSEIKALVSARGRPLAAAVTREKVIVFDTVSGRIQTQTSCECSYVTNNNVAFVDNDQRLLFMDKFHAIALDIASGRRVMDYEMKSNVRRAGNRTTWNWAYMGFVVPRSVNSQEYWVSGDSVGPKVLYEYSNGKLTARRGSPEGTFSFFPAGAQAADIFEDGSLAIGLYKTPRISLPDADQYIWSGLDLGDSALVVGTLTNGRFVTLDKSGEIRIYSRSQQNPLVRTLLYTDGHWLSRTDTGFFSGTREAAENLFLALGNGVSVSVDNLYNALYRPDLVVEASVGDPDGKVKAAAAKLDLEKVMASGSAPKVTITAPTAGTSSATDEVSVEATVSDQGGGIGKVEWRVNGVTSGIETRGLERVAADAASGPGRSLAVKRTLALERGDNRIEVLAYNSKDLIASEPAAVTVNWNGEKSATPPKLFVMAVGVNDYYDSRLKLSYAVPDATAIAEGFRKAGTGLYANVDVTTVLDKDVTIANLDKVFTDVGNRVQPRDVFVFFLAGHGKTKNGRYYFLPRDFRYEDDDSIEKAGMDQDKFQAWFARIPARKSILLYDTCESGSLTGAKIRGSDIDERLGALNRMTRATGRTFLTATTDDAPALEGYHGHGVFTYAILDALDHGDVNKNGLIEVSELADYVDQKVPDISFDAFKLRQIPQRSIVGNNFALTNKAEVLMASTDTSSINKGNGVPASADIPDLAKPTHIVVTSTPMEVFESVASDGTKGSIVQRIPTGTLVVVTRSAGGWDLIARDGQSLGYVAHAGLAPLQ